MALVLLCLDHVATGDLLAARSVGAACGGFGSVRDGTATFDVFY